MKEGNWRDERNEGYPNKVLAGDLFDVCVDLERGSEKKIPWTGLLF